MSSVELARDFNDLPLAPRAPVAGARPRHPAAIAMRAALAALAYVLVTGGLLSGLLMQLREEAVSAAKRELSAFAQLTATHTYEVAFALEQKLKLVQVTLNVAAPTGRADQAAVGPMLAELVRNSRDLKDIVVLDAEGRVMNQATGTADIGANWSDRPFFAGLRNSGAPTFSFGVPLKGSTEAFHGGRLIPVALAWRNSSGQFMGAVVGLMDPAFFSKAWTFDSAIAGLSIALAAADGTILMRQPLVEGMLGQKPADEEVNRELANKRDSGALLALEPVSRTLELQTYRRVAGYPDLLVFVAQPLDFALAEWRRVAWISATCWLLASLALGALGVWLAREMKARGALERRYYALFNSVPQAVIVSDAETGRVLAHNDAAVEQYGWSKDGEAPVLPAEFAVLATRRADFSTDRPRLIAGQRHRNAQGAPIDVELTVREVEVGGRPALLTVAADVSDRVREERARHAAEEQLRQSQKMDTLGQLTGGIAHDFNNALLAIIDGAEELAEQPGLPETVRNGIERIAGAANRAEDLTRRMLAFSQKQPLQPRVSNVNDLVVDTGKLLRRTLGEQVEIDAVLADEVWPVSIDPAQFESLLVNLCLNARDAMPNGGRVVIETSNAMLGREQLLDAPGVFPGEFVRIAVRDSGHGIRPEHLSRIFEPYFTTKPSGSAAGLGLSTVYGFVRQSNGHVEVESNVHRGTTFRIYLPRHAAGASAVAAGAEAAAAAGNERILVVEDDELVRASVVRQLRSLGYFVVEAMNGAAALATFESAAEPFDLVLTDVVMPGQMGGRALADALRQRRPGVRVVFMSGYSGNVLGDGSDQLLLLHKPFRKADLARMVRHALGGGAP